MKCLVIMFALISLAALQSTEETLHNEGIFNTCKEQFGVSADELKVMKENKTDSTNVKSMRACILKAEGLMDDEGRIDKEGTKRDLISFLTNVTSPEVVASVVEGCGSVVANSDHPEAASRHAKCIITQFEARNILNTKLF